MKRGVLILLCLVFLIHFVSAANCGGAVACSCGDTLNESWTMTLDLTSCTGDGIKIGNHSLTLDCNGYDLRGDGGSGDYGIDLSAGGHDNLTIKNCNISNFPYGIYLYSSSNNTLTNNTANSNNQGIYLHSSSNNTLTNNTANSNSDYGFYLYSSSNNILTSNTANSNSQYGFYLHSSSNNILTSNTANSNNQGIYLYSSSSNNVFVSNVLKKNINIIQFLNGNNFTLNQFLDNLNTLSQLETDSQGGTVGDRIDFNFTIKYFNSSDCPSCIYKLDLNPSESSFQHSSNGALVIGNFTPTKTGIYSLKINITDEFDNSEIRKYVYLINATAQDQVNYYFREDYPTHGQPISYGTDHDAGSLLFEAPTSSEDRWCSLYVGFSIDVLPDYLFGIFNEINYSIWYKTNEDGYTGIQRYPEGLTLDYNTSIVTTLKSFGNFNFTVDWASDYFWTWYLMTVKLKGNAPRIYSNATDPSYANITYTYPDTPAIKEITNEDIQLLSATMVSNSSGSSAIVLDGDGSTNISVQMPDTSLTYSILYDGTDCSSNSNCTLNNQTDGKVNLTLTLGSEHTLNIGNDSSAPSITLNPPDNNVTNLNNASFNFTATDNSSFKNATLYSNSSGSWMSNESSQDLISGQSFSININLPDGTYNWNIYSCDVFDNCGFASSNRTLTVDSTSPTGSMSCTPSNAIIESTITCTCSPSDLISGINSSLTSYTLNPSTTSTGTHTTSCSFADIAGNTGSTTTIYVVESGGGGSSSSSSGGGAIYNPPEETLKEEYEKTLKTNDKIEFKFKEETHKLNLDKIIDDKTVQITISSEPITFNLSLNEIKKINLDADSYYDLKVYLNKLTSHEADVVVKLISEEISSDVSDEEKIVGSEEKSDLEKKDSWENYLPYYLIVMGIIFLIVGIVLFSKRKN